MERRTAAGIMLPLLLMSLFVLVFDAHTAEAIGIIYIRADGSVDPSTSPIHRDVDTYTLTENITNSIVIEKDNIVFDGGGHTIRSAAVYPLELKGLELLGRKNVTVKSTRITNFQWCIFLQNSTNNTIEGNNITAKTRNIFSTYGIGMLSSSNNTATSNYISMNDVGVDVDGSSNYNSIVGNTVVGNGLVGIRFAFSSNYNTLRGNDITIGAYGVYVIASSKYNSIVENNITTGGEGICLESSSNNILSGNNLRNNRWGIDLLGSSSNNSIIGNSITGYNNTGTIWGIILDSSSNNKICGNYIAANNVLSTYNFGITLLAHSISNIISGNNVTKNDFGIDITSSSDYNSVYNNEVAANNNAGIRISSSSNNCINRNDITKNGEGVLLASSSSCNSISENNIVGNFHGVHLDQAFSNRISKNNIITNALEGITLESSSNNSIFENKITADNRTDPYDSGIRMLSSSNNSIIENALTGHGLLISTSYRNFVMNNTVNGKPLVYLEGESEYQVSDAGQVVLVRCNRIRVQNLDLSRATIGVQLVETNNSDVSGNNITANSYAGVMLVSSSGNLIIENSIMDNARGINLVSSLNNVIYRNNFIDNTYHVFNINSINAWEDDYPGGGNYWGGYRGVDSKSGVHQDAPGSDGMGDEPYVVDEDNLDHYPLMKPHGAPFGAYDAAVINLAPSVMHAYLGWYVDINVTVRNKGDLAENRTVAIYCDSRIIGLQTVTLAPNTDVLLSFTWNTTSTLPGNCTLIATVNIVLAESDTFDNTLDAKVIVKILGDINGDDKVDTKDLALAAIAFGGYLGRPGWDSEADLNRDGRTDIRDLVIIAKNFGKTYP